MINEVKIRARFAQPSPRTEGRPVQTDCTESIQYEQSRRTFSAEIKQARDKKEDRARKIHSKYSVLAPRPAALCGDLTPAGGWIA